MLLGANDPFNPAYTNNAQTAMEQELTFLEERVFMDWRAIVRNARQVIRQLWLLKDLKRACGVSGNTRRGTKKLQVQILPRSPFFIWQTPNPL